MGKHAPCCAEVPCHAPPYPPSADAQCSFAPMRTEGLSHLHTKKSVSCTTVRHIAHGMLLLWLQLYAQ